MPEVFISHSSTDDAIVTRIHDTLTAAPLDYAGTQNNQGNAYSDLAQVEDRADNLRRAITAFQQALVYRTPTAAPLAYAMTQANLGIAYADSGDLDAAIKCWCEAVKYFEQMGTPAYADRVRGWIEAAGGSCPSIPS
jgi:tetratricopeptide (TPR) repeat protein